MFKTTGPLEESCVEVQTKKTVPSAPIACPTPGRTYARKTEADAAPCLPTIRPAQTDAMDHKSSALLVLEWRAMGPASPPSRVATVAAPIASLEMVVVFAATEL